MSRIGKIRSLISSFDNPCNSNGNATLSYTVRDESKLKCWKIIPICLRSSRNSAVFNFVKSTPSTITDPDVGRSNILIQRIKVDLPAPD